MDFEEISGIICAILVGGVLGIMLFAMTVAWQ